MPITETVTLSDGREAHQVTLQSQGMIVKVVTLGAALQDIRMRGHNAPLILGFADVASYADNKPCMGAIAGRFANRIGNAAFTIDGNTYQLDKNWLGKHTLHGGSDGLQYWNWNIAEITDDSVTMDVTLPDGHMGFPGNLTARCTYTILPNNAVDVMLTATTDAPTVCGLASHCYFNLDGHDTIDHHKLRIACTQALEYDEDHIPTGNVVDVTGTARDFSQPRGISDGLLDSNFCLSSTVEPLRDVATVITLNSERSLTIATNQPGLQVYNAPEFSSPYRGLDGRQYGDYAGLAIEPQNWPNAPRDAQFPKAVLRPGETYVNHSQFKFS
ncbi:aldose epimerase family protein [Cognatishimia sp. 1_MG-2023]|uniref:aldose epimerase family protein n=1 Tax=Cognatishimia sp. 1_MG-2023 TaxID=3062642 RepID=UPI0026E1212F|nr:aldose epimerase family protein [Cognatishimia sp. 1_MG-2023]MDO6727593.1 aldose epimerase family protein [Cognatishimia sp. 1_MG-2023]